MLSVATFHYSSLVILDWLLISLFLPPFLVHSFTCSLVSPSPRPLVSLFYLLSYSFGTKGVIIIPPLRNRVAKKLFGVGVLFPQYFTLNVVIHIGVTGYENELTIRAIGT